MQQMAAAATELTDRSPRVEPEEYLRLLQFETKGRLNKWINAPSGEFTYMGYTNSETGEEKTKKWKLEGGEDWHIAGDRVSIIGPAYVLGTETLPVIEAAVRKARWDTENISAKIGDGPLIIAPTADDLTGWDKAELSIPPWLARDSDFLAALTARVDKKTPAATKMQETTNGYINGWKEGWGKKNDGEHHRVVKLTGPQDEIERYAHFFRKIIGSKKEQEIRAGHFFEKIASSPKSQKYLKLFRKVAANGTKEKYADHINKVLEGNAKPQDIQEISDNRIKRYNHSVEVEQTFSDATLSIPVETLTPAFIKTVRSGLSILKLTEETQDEIIARHSKAQRNDIKRSPAQTRLVA